MWAKWFHFAPFFFAFLQNHVIFVFFGNSCFSDNFMRMYLFCTKFLCVLSIALAEKIWYTVKK